MKRILNKKREILIGAFFAMFVLSAVPVSVAQTSQNQTTDNREIKVYTPYPHISIISGNSISQEVIIKNTGDTDEILNISTISPVDDWRVELLSGKPYEINSIYIPAGENKTLTLSTQTSALTPVGLYNLQVDVSSIDGKVDKTMDLQVRIRESFEKEVVISGGTRQIQGPRNKNFEVQLTITNRGDAKTINYETVYARRWEVSVSRPGKDAWIGSEFYSSGESKTVSIQIDPSPRAEQGAYPVRFIAASGDFRDNYSLNVKITGTYSIELKTETGKMNLDAVKGGKRTITLEVVNKGTAELQNVTFGTPRLPEGWNTDFSPDSIPVLTSNETKKVDLTIQPASDALPGDYMTKATASVGSPVYRSDDIEIRVTAYESTQWAYIGAGIVAAVLIGLFIAFWRLGRR